MRHKFVIRYPKDHPDSDKAGKKYKPPSLGMVVMNDSGIFFLFRGDPYYPSINRLSDVLPKYDVEWVEVI